MERNYFASIEFDGLYSNILVLSKVNDQLYVVAKERCLTMGFSKGYVTDFEVFQNNIKSLIESVKNKYNFEINEIILVLPTVNHNKNSVYVSCEIMTENRIIGRKQIDSLRQSAKNSVNIKNDECIVEEIPDFYMLDDGVKLHNPPINYQTLHMSLQSMVHTLPIKIVNDLTTFFKDLKIDVLDYYLSSRCTNKAIEKSIDLNKQTIQVSIGDEQTLISAYNLGQLLETRNVDFGIADIIKNISDNLKLSFEESYKLFKSYFSFNELYMNAINLENYDFSIKDINTIVKAKISEAAHTIIQKINDVITSVSFNNIDYILTGKLNDIDGFVDYFSKASQRLFKECNIKVYSLNDQEYINCYGAIKLYLENNKDYVLKRMSYAESIEVHNDQSVKEKKVENKKTFGFKDVFDE